MKRIFLGSANESLPFLLELAEAARALQNEPVEVVLIPWNGLFPLGNMTLDVLTEILPSFDGAVFMLGEQDEPAIAMTSGRRSRDNVFLELGIALGRLGRSKALLACPKGVHIGSDMAGVVRLEIPGGPLRDCAERVAHIIVQHFVPDLVEGVAGERRRESTDSILRDLDNHARPAMIETMLPDIGGLNDRYYRRFESYLEGSREFVLMVGSGFEFYSDRAASRVERFLSVVEACADRHPLVRIETAMTEMRYRPWVELMVSRLANKKGTRILRPRRDQFLLRDICLIDPGTPDAVVVLMFPASCPDQDKRVDRAGVGMFIRSQFVADALQRVFARLLDPKSPESIREVRGEELIAEYLSLKQ